MYYAIISYLLSLRNARVFKLQGILVLDAPAGSLVNPSYIHDL